MDIDIPLIFTTFFPKQNYPSIWRPKLLTQTSGMSHKRSHQVLQLIWEILFSKVNASRKDGYDRTIILQWQPLCTTI